MSVDTTAGNGTTALTFDDTWHSWSGVHGGYLAARVAAAATTLTDDQPLRAAHFLFHRPLDSQTAQVMSQVLHSGRSTTVVDAHVRGESAATAAGRFVTGASTVGATYDARPSPPAARPESCSSFAFPTELVPFAQHLEVRPVDDARPLSGGAIAKMTAWVRLRPSSLTGEQALIVLLDALPPALYAATKDPVPIPSVDLSMHFHHRSVEADPAEWHLMMTETMSAANGWCVDDSHIWNSEGLLLGTARQTRRILGNPALTV